jgi:hypothetical protein
MMNPIQELKSRPGAARQAASGRPTRARPLAGAADPAQRGLARASSPRGTDPAAPLPLSGRHGVVPAALRWTSITGTQATQRQRRPARQDGYLLVYRREHLVVSTYPAPRRRGSRNGTFNDPDLGPSGRLTPGKALTVMAAVDARAPPNGASASSRPLSARSAIHSGQSLSPDPTMSREVPEVAGSWRCLRLGGLLAAGRQAFGPSGWPRRSFV